VTTNSKPGKGGKKRVGVFSGKEKGFDKLDGGQ